MGTKKTQQHKTINKIDNLTVEIDYDKLADAIVKAEKKAAEDNSTLSKTFSALSALVFQITSIAGFVISVLGLVIGIEMVIEQWGPANRLNTVIFAITILLFWF